MRNAGFFLMLILLSQKLYGQECSCAEKLRMVKEKVEENYAGFIDKVNYRTHSTYNAFSQVYAQQALDVRKPQVFYMLIHDWLAYFKDGHLALAGGVAEDSSSLQELMRNTETITLSNSDIARLKKLNKGIEGLYTTEDSLYTIAVVNGKNDYRDLVGVIIDSRNDLWKFGQVKMELLRVDSNRYKVLYYGRDHNYSVYEFVFNGNSFGDSWYRVGYRRPATENASSETVQMRRLADSTLYLKISSFNPHYGHIVDSLMNANKELLRTSAYLIVDVRGNGGGADFVYQPVSRWIYSRPIQHVGVDVLATQDNISGWREAILESPEIPDDTKKHTRELIKEIKRSLGRFVSSSSDETQDMGTVEPNPRRVAILIDQGCASSTEQFLLEARQSQKVVLMGYHTAGVLDYSNVRPVTSLPCKDIRLYVATTRSRRLNKGLGIDNVGIQPNVILDKGKDWIAEAVKYLHAK